MVCKNVSEPMHMNAFELYIKQIHIPGCSLMKNNKMLKIKEYKSGYLKCQPNRCIGVE